MISTNNNLWEAQWPIGYGVRLRIKRSSVRIRLWPLRWVLGQGSLLPLPQGEAFTLASISSLAILVKYILAKIIIIKRLERARQVFKLASGPTGESEVCFSPLCSSSMLHGKKLPGTPSNYPKKKKGKEKTEKYTGHNSFLISKTKVQALVP